MRLTISIETRRILSSSVQFCLTQRTIRYDPALSIPRPASCFAPRAAIRYRYRVHPPLRTECIVEWVFCCCERRGGGGVGERGVQRRGTAIPLWTERSLAFGRACSSARFRFRLESTARDGAMSQIALLSQRQPYHHPTQPHRVELHLSPTEHGGRRY